MLKKLERDTTKLITKSLQKSFPALKASDLAVNLEIPRDRKHGDLASNVAFSASASLKKNPYEIAARVSETASRLIVSSKLSAKIRAIEPAKPGFINITFTDKFYYKYLRSIANYPKRIKPGNLGRGRKVQIEFVSANPTGPLSVAHGRQAAVGDTLANILSACNYKVVKEYFINDEGNQIDALAKSVMARLMQLQGKDASLPPDGYQGDYIIEIAKAFNDKFHQAVSERGYINILKMISNYSVKKILNQIKQDLERMNVEMDVWYSQKTLTKEHKVEEIIRILIKTGLIYEKEDALWFKSTSFGDDKDRVVVKSDGQYTYLAPDIAYHREKIKRRFKKVINIWGPDHHGYIARLKAATRALGASDDFLNIIIIQLATLYRQGKAISMSTRKGEYITLGELLDEVGADVSRFFFLMRKESSHLDFDLELAKKKSLDNPVFYVQYAHARICSILKSYKPGKKKISRTRLKLLKSPDEIDLIRLLLEYPTVLEAIAKNLEPYFLSVYLRQVAEAFHSFYQKHRVLSEDPRLTAARIKLIKGTRNIIKHGLDLMGISAPTSM